MNLLKKLEDYGEKEIDEILECSENLADALDILEEDPDLTEMPSVLFPVRAAYYLIFSPSENA